MTLQVRWNASGLYRRPKWYKSVIPNWWFTDYCQAVTSFMLVQKWHYNKKLLPATSLLISNSPVTSESFVLIITALLHRGFNGKVRYHTITFLFIIYQSDNTADLWKLKLFHMSWSIIFNCEFPILIPHKSINCYTANKHV